VRSAATTSLSCLSEKHGECKRVRCACECHEGGVRELVPSSPEPVEGSGRTMMKEV
jgi:hypothetical protein